jgi:hypothetical protein
VACLLGGFLTNLMCRSLQLNGKINIFSRANSPIRLSSFGMSSVQLFSVSSHVPYPKDRYTVCSGYLASQIRSQGLERNGRFHIFS